MATASPVTPAKRSSWQPILHDSPMSEYFAEDVRSIDYHMASTPLTTTEQLLERMDRLQSQLQHGEHAEAINVIGRKLSEIERELGALHSQTRFPADLEDSGLFLNEDDDDDNDTDQPHDSSAMAEQETPNREKADRDSKLTLNQVQAERDYFLAEMQRLLHGLGRAQTQLRQRYVEFHEINERHVRQIEERDRQLQESRAENEALKTDLAFDHTELLFLKLQLKAMEVDVNEGNGSEGGQKTNLLIHDPKAIITRTKRNRILAEMDRWHADWQEVDSRFKRRRNQYGVLPTLKSDDDSTADSVAESQTEDRVEWQLEAVKEKCGRVNALTIKRIDGRSESENEREEQVEEDDDGEDTEEEDTILSPREYADQSTQTDSMLDHRIEPTHNAYDPLDNESGLVSAEEKRNDDVQPQTVKSQKSRTKRRNSQKTAWQELWEGLSHLSGMSDEKLSSLDY